MPLLSSTDNFDELIMSLDKLPRDILLLITDRLRSRDIESLALTFNTQITAICIPQLKNLFEFRKKLRRSIRNTESTELFRSLGDEFIERHKGKFDIPARAKLLPCAERSKEHNPIEHNGTLSWLRSKDENRPDDLFAVDSYYPPSRKEIDILQRDVKALGITLPRAFVKFLSDPRITDGSCRSGRSISDGDMGFSLGHAEFAKVSASIDQGAGGHVLLFAGGAGQNQTYVSLYIEPGPSGAHCIISSDMDPRQPWDEVEKWGGLEELEEIMGDDKDVIQEEREQSDRTGRPLAFMVQADAHCRFISFEEWLHETHVESWLIEVCHDEKAKPTVELKAYVRSMYDCAPVRRSRRLTSR